MKFLPVMRIHDKCASCPRAVWRNGLVALLVQWTGCGEGRGLGGVLSFLSTHPPALDLSCQRRG